MPPRVATPRVCRAPELPPPSALCPSCPLLRGVVTLLSELSGPLPPSSSAPSSPTCCCSFFALSSAGPACPSSSQAASASGSSNSAGPKGRFAPNFFAPLSCLSIVRLGSAPISNLTAQCCPDSPDDQSASPTIVVLWTAWSSDRHTTKKSIFFPLQVYPSTALTTPPTSLSHPVAANCSGVPCQSPPMIQGPSSTASLAAMHCSRSRFRLAPIPILHSRYEDPQ